MDIFSFHSDSYVRIRRWNCIRFSHIVTWVPRQPPRDIMGAIRHQHVGILYKSLLCKLIQRLDAKRQEVKDNARSNQLPAHDT